MEISPRIYQLKAFSKTLGGWEHARRQLCVMPTGTGKTVVQAMLVQHGHKNRENSLVLVPSTELVRQSSSKIHSATGQRCLIEQAENWADIGAEDNKGGVCVVASVQSMTRSERLDRFPKDYFRYVIVDEAHHCIAPSYAPIFERFDEAMTVGFTATPDRGDKKSLAKYFERISHEYTLKEAINDGWCCPIVAMTLPVNIDLNKAKVTAGDIDLHDADDAIKPYLQDIARQAHNVAAERFGIFFLTFTDTSRMMAGLLRSAGFMSNHIDGGMDKHELEFLMSEFRAKKFGAICNAKLLSEGVDIPHVDMVVPLRPTKSRALYAQQVGRGTRICEGKENVLLLDFLWHSERHSLCHPASLICQDEEAQDIATGRIANGETDLLAACEAAEEAVIETKEKALARYLDENKTRKPGTIDPISFATWTHEKEIIEYEPIFEWEKRPATEGQKSALQRAGIDYESITAGYASRVIDAIKRRSHVGLATPPQLKTLRRFGRKDVAGVTFRSAGDFLGARLQKKRNER
jgi:superfamily II DNA or RNA helicase